MYNIYIYDNKRLTPLNPLRVLVVLFRGEQGANVSLGLWEWKDNGCPAFREVWVVFQAKMV